MTFLLLASKKYKTYERVLLPFIDLCTGIAKCREFITGFVHRALSAKYPCIRKGFPQSECVISSIGLFSTIRSFFDVDYYIINAIRILDTSFICRVFDKFRKKNIKLVEATSSISLYTWTFRVSDEITQINNIHECGWILSNIITRVWLKIQIIVCIYDTILHIYVIWNHKNNKKMGDRRDYNIITLFNATQFDSANTNPNG